MANVKYGAPPTSGALPAASKTGGGTAAVMLSTESALPQNGPAKSYMSANSDIAGWNDAPALVRNSAQMLPEARERACAEVRAGLQTHLGALYALLDPAAAPAKKLTAMDGKMIADAEQRVAPLVALRADDVAFPDSLLQHLGQILQGMRERRFAAAQASIPPLITAYPPHAKALIGLKRLADLVTKFVEP